MDDFLRKRLAVALKYKYQEDSIPKVLAIGRGLLAEEILRRAQEHHIPVHADKNLAELLGEVEVGHAIPEELFDVVAQLMAMVYRIDNQVQNQASSQTENQLHRV